MIEIPTAIFWTVLIGLVAYGVWKSVESQSNKSDADYWRSKTFHSQDMLSNKSNDSYNENSELRKRIFELERKEKNAGYIPLFPRLEELKLAILARELRNEIKELKEKLNEKDSVKTSSKFKAKVKSALRDLEKEKSAKRI